jgi:hypothetical protein
MQIDDFMFMNIGIEENSLDASQFLIMLLGRRMKETQI